MNLPRLAGATGPEIGARAEELLRNWIGSSQRARIRELEKCEGKARRAIRPRRRPGG